VDRRLRIVIVVLGAIVGATLIALFNTNEAELRAWVEEDPRPRARVVVSALAVAVSGPVLACSAYLWFVDRRRMMRIVAGVLTVAALAIVFFLFRLVNLLEAAA
jgi:hypothetical protein